MPLVFPHGIDYFQAKVLCDLHCHEPLYVATRQDIYEKAIKLREVIKFPHPWLFLIDADASPLGDGTLFIAPDPGLGTNEELYKGILAQDFVKPWGILLKERGLIKEDFEWWRVRGFRTHCVGNHTNLNFYQDLKNVLSGYIQVATAQFTSAAFFAASLSMRVRIIEDVCTNSNHRLQYGQHSSPHHREDVNDKIKDVWSRLTSSDLDVSREVALEYLGIDFMGTKEELKSRYHHAINCIKRPLHLYPIHNINIYNIILKLIAVGIPVYKFYPFPIRKVISRLRAFIGFHHVLYIRAAEFHDFGIISDKGYHEEKAYWFFNPFVTSHIYGNRFFPRWSFIGLRSLVSFLKLK